MRLPFDPRPAVGHLDGNGMGRWPAWPLAGATGGILSTAKPNADAFLEQCMEALSDSYNVQLADVWHKPRFSEPAPGELLDQIAAGASFVLTGVGD